MFGRSWWLPALPLALAVFAAAANSGLEARPSAQQVSLACERVPITWGDRGLMPLEGRASPYDSALVTIGGGQAKICYGRPSVRERVIFGGLVPYDTLWRTGANEPTTLHLGFPADLAGVRLDPGSYTLYTVPRQGPWTLIVNASTSQFGQEIDYTPDVRAHELARVPVPSERIETAVETFTIRSVETGADAGELLLEWENTRVRIPIRRL